MSLRSFFAMVFSWRPVDAAQLDKSPWPERGFTLLSVILGVVGVAISGWQLHSPDLPPAFQLVKDLSIFITLLILTLYFFLRYRRAVSEIVILKATHAEQLSVIRGLLGQQVETYQSLMSQTRSSFFYATAAGPGYQHRLRYDTPGLNEMLRDSLNHVLGAVREILESHFRSQEWKAIDLSLSVKAHVTGETAKDLCDLTDEQKAAILPGKHYIITLDRDQKTKSHIQSREVKSHVYEVRENSDFARIISEELEYFEENNLKRLSDIGQYNNSSPRWSDFYNATQVIPIRHKVGAKTHIYGFLTVDSRNVDERQLFDPVVTRSILTFGADLLALLFLALEMCDRAAKNGSHLAVSALPPEVEPIRKEL